MLFFLKATVDGWRRSLLNGRGTGHSGRLTLDTRRQSLQWVLGQHIACIACVPVYLYFVWSYLYLWSSICICICICTCVCVCICICICIWWWQSLQLVPGQHIACTCDLGSKNRYKICESVQTRIFLVLKNVEQKVQWVLGQQIAWNTCWKYGIYKLCESVWPRISLALEKNDIAVQWIL